MIEEQGRVTRMAGGKLAIEVTTPGACDSCPVRGNCYPAGRVAWVPAREGIRVGDRVRFSITNASVLKVSALLYGVPLAAVVGGILLGELWLFRSFGEDPRALLSFGLGLLLFAAGGFALSRLDRLLPERLVYTVARAEPQQVPAGAAGPKDESLP